MHDHLVMVPKRLSDVSEADMWDFVRCIHAELDANWLTDDERAKLLHVTQAFGIIFDRHAYFRQAYCLPMQRAVQSIFGPAPQAKILDIGCGTGTQAILFGLLGGSVIGLDRDEMQLQTARRRTEFYQTQLQRTIPVEFRSADLLQHDFSQYRGFDALYSHGCMARILTADQIFQIGQQVLQPHGRVVLKIGNRQCLWTRLLRIPNDLNSGGEFEASAQRHGFRPLYVRGTTAIPRAFWRLGNLTHGIDRPLRAFRALAIHLELAFERVD